MANGNGFVTEKPKSRAQESQPQETQAERVQYQGKTPEGYQEFAGKKKLEHHFAVAHVGAVQDTDSIEDLQARLTAQMLLQRQASGSTAAKVAQYIIGGQAGYDSAKTDLMNAIDGHFVVEECNQDFFMKSLASGSSLPQLGAAE